MAAGSDPIPRIGRDEMYRPPDNNGGDNGGNAGREQVSLEDLIGRFKGGLPPIKLVSIVSSVLPSNITPLEVLIVST